MFPFAKFGYQSTHFADKILFKRYGTIRRFLTINFCHQTINKQLLTIRQMIVLTVIAPAKPKALHKCLSNCLSSHLAWQAGHME